MKRLGSLVGGLLAVGVATAIAWCAPEAVAWTHLCDLIAGGFPALAYMGFRSTHVPRDPQRDLDRLCEAVEVAVDRWFDDGPLWPDINAAMSDLRTVLAEVDR